MKRTGGVVAAWCVAVAAACGGGGGATDNLDSTDVDDTTDATDSPAVDAAVAGPDAAGTTPDAAIGTPDAACAGEVCDGTCVDTQTSIDHCGACDAPCVAGDNVTAVVCAEGACGLTCAPGYFDCDGEFANGCEVAPGDEAACGSCEIACDAGEVCDVDACVVAPGVASFTTDVLPAAGGGAYAVTFTEAVAWDTAQATLTCGGALAAGGAPVLPLPTTADDITFTFAMADAMMLGSACTLDIPAASVTSNATGTTMVADAAATMAFSQLSEDFQATESANDGSPRRIFPAGWALDNLDNRTPAGAVNYVNAAWIVREDFAYNVGDYAAFSTSWYAPAGAADDWMFAPMTHVGTACVASWNGITYDAMYLDSYELWFCPTTSGADCKVNGTKLATVDPESSSWTAHSADLAGVAGSEGRLAWRNFSDDKFLLLVDDIVVTCP